MEALNKPRDFNTFLFLHSVNHNLFGFREGPKKYANMTLAEMEEKMTAFGASLGVKVVCAQSNYEGELCDLIQYSRCFGGIVFNRKWLVFPSAEYLN